MQQRPPVAMTIAGSDSGPGAGIQADQNPSRRCVYGTTTLTAITAQNALGVFAVHEIPTEVIAAQIDAVATDIGVDAAKTGTPSSEHIIETFADRVRHWSLRHCVVVRVGARVADSSDQPPGLRQLDEGDLSPTCPRVAVPAHAQREHGGGHGTYVVLPAGRA